MKQSDRSSGNRTAEPAAPAPAAAPAARVVMRKASGAPAPARGAPVAPAAHHDDSFSDAVNAGIGADDASGIAQRGLAGAPSAFPFQAQIEASFGRALGATAHTDAGAAEACGDLGAEAFASGSGVAFASSTPSLHTAAHEAAHVLQQASGVHL